MLKRTKKNHVVVEIEEAKAVSCLSCARWRGVVWSVCAYVRVCVCCFIFDLDSASLALPEIVAW
jgi:hypothetical protein